MRPERNTPGAGVHRAPGQRASRFEPDASTRLSSLALDDGIPIVRCCLKGDDLIVARCPICGRRHVHGAAGQTGPDFGHRLAHCYFSKPDPAREAARRRGYLLVS